MNTTQTGPLFSGTTTSTRPAIIIESTTTTTAPQGFEGKLIDPTKKGHWNFMNGVLRIETPDTPNLLQRTLCRWLLNIRWIPHPIQHETIWSSTDTRILGK